MSGVGGRLRFSGNLASQGSWVSSGSSGSVLLVGLGLHAHRQPSSPRGTAEPLATGLETLGDSAGKISMCVSLKQSLFLLLLDAQRSHISQAPSQLCVPTRIHSDPWDVAEATYTIPGMDSNGLPTVVRILSLSGSAVWRGNQGGCRGPVGLCSQETEGVWSPGRLSRASRTTTDVHWTAQGGKQSLAGQVP